MKYEEVKELFEDQNAIVMFDTDDEMDWSADWGGEWKPHFKSDGIHMPHGWIAVEKTWIYPYSEVQLVTFDGFKLAHIEEGDLESIRRVTVHNLNPTFEGSRALRQLEQYGHREEYEEKMHLWLAVFAKGKLSWVILGDPIQVFGISFEWIESGLLIHQADGARALVGNDAGIYLMS